MTPPKFLITGATGATGGNSARKLLEKAHSVRVLAHRPDERSEQLRKICRGQAVSRQPTPRLLSGAGSWRSAWRNGG